MLQKEVREPLERCFCSCVVDSHDLCDDGKPVEQPTRIGGSILFCGKRKSTFPFHCMVGPDWPFVALVYIMIIVINAVVLYVISPIGWIPVIIGLIGAVFLLIAFTKTAFSDPGIIYKNDFGSKHGNPNDVETGSNTISSLNVPILTNTSTIIPAGGGTVDHTIECGKCELRRPYTARHCDYCKICVDNLDHHCPW